MICFHGEDGEQKAALREYVWLDDLPLAVVADVDTATPHLYFVHADARLDQLSVGSRFRLARNNHKRRSCFNR